MHDALAIVEIMHNIFYPGSDQMAQLWMAIPATQVARGQCYCGKYVCVLSFLEHTIKIIIHVHIITVAEIVLKNGGGSNPRICRRQRWGRQGYTCADTDVVC